VSGSTTSATSPKPELRLAEWINWYNAEQPTRRSVIAARVSSVGTTETRGLIPGVHVWTQPRAQGCCSDDTDVRLRSCIRPLDGAPCTPGHDGNPRVFFYDTTSASRALHPSQV
jgi:hypothetical protein